MKAPNAREPDKPSGAATIFHTRRELFEAMRAAGGSHRFASDDEEVMAREHARVRRARIDFVEHALEHGLVAGPALHDAEHDLAVNLLMEKRENDDDDAEW